MLLIGSSNAKSFEGKGEFGATHDAAHLRIEILLIHHQRVLIDPINKLVELHNSSTKKSLLRAHS